MPEYLAPGVFVEEVDRGPKPIEGVGTAMPVFVGFTEKAIRVKRVNSHVESEAVLGQAQLITNWSQYQESFGDFVNGAYLPHAVYGYFLNGGSRCYVLSVKTIPKAQAGLVGSDGKPHLMVRAKQAGYAGERLRVSIEEPKQLLATTEQETAARDKAEDKVESKAKDKETQPPPAGNGTSSGFNLVLERQRDNGKWDKVKTFQEVSLVETETDNKKTVRVAYKLDAEPKLIELVLPERKVPLAKLWPKAQQQTLKLEQRSMTPATYRDYQGSELDRLGLLGLAGIDDATMICTPDLMTPQQDQPLDLGLVKSVQELMISHCQQMGDRVAILDPPPHMNPQEIKAWRMDTTGFDSSYAALYYPWLQVMDPVSNEPMMIPPSGHMAGIWARSDNSRGVHKAPANEVVAGATGLTHNTTKGEQETLNPNGVNCIRALPGRGVRVWGARTLSSDPAWRYINVRRLFNFVEKSIERSTQWVVFEPNDRLLWARVRRDVSAFLSTVWSTGALFGKNPAEAFYVKCDEELNPQAVRDQGQLIIEIGMAPVKPAEFVIFRISQWSPEIE